MGIWREIGFVTGRFILGMVVQIGVLVILILIVHLSDTMSTTSERVAAAYDDGYAQGYTQTYKTGYEKAYREAYDKGYDKGHEIGFNSGFEGEVTRRVELRNPTYSELTEFLIRDKTDSNLFVRDEYVCFNFAADLNNSAEASGIRAAYVRIRFKEWAHAIIAFETVDRGLVFIEPQSDKPVSLEVGTPYLWGPSGAIRTTDYDDTVVEIQLIW